MSSASLQLFGWGAFEDNQLGFSTSSQQMAEPQPMTVSNSNKITQIACGYKHTLLLNQDGEVYSCGGDEYGQLGRGQEKSVFNRISALENQIIIDITCGAYHSAAINYAGRLYTWGCNSNGQLGREGEDSSVKMVRSLAEHRVVQVSLGLEHSLVLTETSLVFSFGSNIWGQLGLGFFSENPIAMPQQLMCLAGLPIRSIHTGGQHCVVVTISGSMFTWGGNKYGQLGLGNAETVAAANATTTATTNAMYSRSSIEMAKHHCITVPSVIRSLKDHCVVRVACGEAHTVVLTQEGRVFTFGANQSKVDTGECVWDHILAQRTLDVVDYYICRHYGRENPETDASLSTSDSRFGQLGYSDFSKCNGTPRQVIDLTGHLITQISCGRMHTLALAPNTGRVYAFGTGTEGQLGTQSGMENSAQPVRVFGPWLAATSAATTGSTPSTTAGQFVVLRICAGGDHSIAMTQKDPLRDCTTPEDARQWVPMAPRSIATLCPLALVNLHNAMTALPLPAPSMLLARTSSMHSERSGSLNGSESQHSSSAAVERLISVYSSLGCLSASCLTANHTTTGRTDHGVDLDDARDLQNRLFQKLPPNQLNRLINCLMTKVLDLSRPNYPSIESLRGFMLLAVSDLLNTPKQPASTGSSDTTKPTPLPDITMESTDTDDSLYPLLKAGFSNPGLVLKAFAMSLNKLETAPSKIIDRWFGKIQPRYFKKLVTNLNNFIVYILHMQPATTNIQRKEKEEGIRSSLELMKRLHQINESQQHPISYISFYIPSVKTKVDIDSAFVSWLRECETNSVRFFSFFDYPFIFDATTKAHILGIEARLSMQQAQQNALLQNVLSPMFAFAMHPSAAPVFCINVRRDQLLQDTLTHITNASPSDFRKLLRVKFEGEEALDEGGVIKEFFLLIMRDILSPIYGMFRCYPESRILWFNELNMESDNMFLMVGILCGLAIYNSIIVDLSFPLAMFRKLLGGTPGLDDLLELDPTLGRSLHQLLDYEGEDVEDTFCLNFSLDIDFFGEVRRVELMENGTNVYVTQANKVLFVEKYVDHVFNQSCKSHYLAFERGFKQVCAGQALKFFRPSELQSLVVGSEVVNWAELRSNTSYKGIYWDRHCVIEWFWEVLLIEFCVEDKKKFLRFLTGSDRVPIVGFVDLKITIQPMNCSDKYLPVAHTCANLLDLPQYSSKAVLANKLSTAVQHTEGFGLV